MSTDTEEVIDVCKQIENMKSSGVDEISSRICEDTTLVIPDKLAFLFKSPYD